MARSNYGIGFNSFICIFIYYSSIGRLRVIIGKYWFIYCFGINNVLFKKNRLVQAGGIEILASEVLKLHMNLKEDQAKTYIIELLRKVGISQADKTINDYPHQLSGGLRQRIMIAQAIAAKPKLIIADEPTSNLDVTLQAQILELFKELKETFGLSILLITHDLAVVSHLADRTVVIHAGEIIEEGRTSEVLEKPKHSYTQQLLEAVKI